MHESLDVWHKGPTGETTNGFSVIGRHEAIVSILSADTAHIRTFWEAAQGHSPRHIPRYDTRRSLDARTAGEIDDLIATKYGLKARTRSVTRLSTTMCSRQESNLHHNLRKVASYPLNDGSVKNNVT